MEVETAAEVVFALRHRADILVCIFLHLLFGFAQIQVDTVVIVKPSEFQAILEKKLVPEWF